VVIAPATSKREAARFAKARERMHAKYADAFARLAR
jgi:hypothetical protein